MAPPTRKKKSQKDLLASYKAAIALLTTGESIWGNNF
jgi:hypothetical protein